MELIDCAFIGDLNPDIVLRGNSMPVLGREVFCDDFYLTLGGSTSICAAVFSNLGGSGGLFGRIGDDWFGKFTVDALKTCGVDTSGIHVCAGKHSPVTISFAAEHDRALLTYQGTCGSIEERDIPVNDILRRVRHIHIGSFFLQPHLAQMFADIFESAHRTGITTSLDAGWDPTEKWDPALFGLLRFTDIFFPNESEATAITGEQTAAAAARKLSEFCRVAVVKCGAKGSVLASEKSNFECPIYDKYGGKDYTGAGDSYNAGFLRAFLAGKPMFDCMKYGTATAALRISADRRKRPFASMNEVNAVLKEDTKGRWSDFS
jgi:sugar/nucleoside kinase (ribokinase family)